MIRMIFKLSLPQTPKGESLKINLFPLGIKGKNRLIFKSVKVELAQTKNKFSSRFYCHMLKQTKRM